MITVQEKHTAQGRKAINARVAAVSLCAAGGGLALLLGSSGWALPGLLVWALSAVVAFWSARSSQNTGPLDEAAILAYLKNNPDSPLAAQVTEVLRTADNEEASGQND